ncbi:MAG: hypothetical protein AAF586_01860 [Planctomycetota bacterium]
MYDLPDRLRRFDDCIAELVAVDPPALPRIRSKWVIAGNDYCGDRKGCVFDVVSTVMVDRDSIKKWDLERLRLRNRHLGDTRRLSFKRLGDKKKQALLPEFLRVSDELNGMCFCLAIHKKLKSFMSDQLGFNELFKGVPVGSQGLFEARLRVAFLNSFLMTGLCLDGVSLEWISDEDRIIQNFAMAPLIGRMNHILGDSQLGDVIPFSTGSDTERRDLEDYVALADFSAAYCSYLATAMVQGGVPEIGQEVHMQEGLIPTKGELIADWWDHPSRLRKIMMLITPGDPGDLYAVRFFGPNLASIRSCDIGTWNDFLQHRRMRASRGRIGVPPNFSWVGKANIGQRGRWQ